MAEEREGAPAAAEPLLRITITVDAEHKASIALAGSDAHNFMHVRMVLEDFHDWAKMKSRKNAATAVQAARAADMPPRTGLLKHGG